MGALKQRLTRLAPALEFAMLGAASFWLPQILWHTLSHTGEVRELAVLNVVCPVALVATYAIVRRRAAGPAFAPSRAFYMAAGVWFLCPAFASIDFCFFGGSFAGDASVASSLFAILYATLFPPMTLITAMMARQMFGFPLAILVMLVLHRRLERSHWILPPAKEPPHRSSTELRPLRQPLAAECDRGLGAGALGLGGPGHQPHQLGGVSLRCRRQHDQRHRAHLHLRWAGGPP